MSARCKRGHLDGLFPAFMQEGSCALMIKYIILPQQKPITCRPRFFSRIVDLEWMLEKG